MGNSRSFRHGICQAVLWCITLAVSAAVAASAFAGGGSGISPGGGPDTGVASTGGKKAAKTLPP